MASRGQHGISTGLLSLLSPPTSLEEGKALWQMANVNEAHCAPFRATWAQSLTEATRPLVGKWKCACSL